MFNFACNHGLTPRLISKNDDNISRSDPLLKQTTGRGSLGQGLLLIGADGWSSDFVSCDRWIIMRRRERADRSSAPVPLFTARSPSEWMLLSNRPKMDRSKQLDHGWRSGSGSRRVMENDVLRRSMATPWQDETTADSADTDRAGLFAIPLD